MLRITKLKWPLALLVVVSTNHFMQRPLRDAAATWCGPENINWLMSGSFLGAIALTFLLLALEKWANIKKSIPFILILVAIAQLVLYYQLQKPNATIAFFYFVFNSTTSLTVMSLVWRQTIQNRGDDLINTYTASNIGAIVGPAIALFTSGLAKETIILLISAALLLISSIGLFLWRTDDQPKIKTSPLNFPFKRLLVFMLLYTFIATGFYFFLIKTVTLHLPEKNKTQLFSLLDLITNCSVLVLPYLLRKWNQKSVAFLIVPCISLLLLSTLGMKLTIITAIGAIVIFKVSNLSLQRPARELLFLQSSLTTPYSTKNFYDTTIYRLGDVAAAWSISWMISSGFHLTQIVSLFSIAGLFWLASGYLISKNIKLIS